MGVHNDSMDDRNSVRVVRHFVIWHVGIRKTSIVAVIRGRE